MKVWYDSHEDKGKVPRMIQKAALLIWASRGTCTVGRIDSCDSPSESQVYLNESMKEEEKQGRIEVLLQDQAL